MACGLLKQRGHAFRLLLVGNENTSGTETGPITKMIADAAAEAGFSDWLIMPGRVPHEVVHSYYSLLDICPFPRKPWPVCEMVSPMKPLEALAMEKLVIVSSVRALLEMIDHDRTGLVFTKGDIASLADTLERAMASPELRKTLGTNGRAWVETERTWRTVGLKAARLLAPFVTPNLPAIQTTTAAPTPAGEQPPVTAIAADTALAAQAAPPQSLLTGPTVLETGDAQ
jgi:glycosyltransferase involved in cell wall biosynthesis